MLKVLYIHHCSDQGGASRSLKEMIEAFPKGEVLPFLISPRGSASTFFEKAGFSTITVKGVSKFDISQPGYYRGLRWLIILRELWYIPTTLYALLKAKKIWGSMDLIHVNDIQSMMPLWLAKRIFKIPAVQHVRCPVMTRRGKRHRFLENFLKKHAAVTIAIDQTVRNTLSNNFPVKVIHNGFKVNTSNLSSLNSENKFANGKRLTVGMVSNLLIFKGVLDFIEAAKICISKGMNIDFIIVGGKSRVQKSFLDTFLKKMGFKYFVDTQVYDLINEYNLTENFQVQEFVQDIAEAYKKMDLHCFPSHINAVGRPVFEAGFLKVPSIVAIEDPQDDAIVHEQTGLCISKKSPNQLAEAIEYFYNSPERITQLGQKAYELAKKNYNVYDNAAKMLEVYKNIK